MAIRKSISTGTRFAVFSRDKFKCQYCGQSPATSLEVILHVDHKTPVSRGGTNDITNLVTACSKCNLGKAAKFIDQPSINWQDEAIRVCGLLKEAHWVAVQEHCDSERSCLFDAYLANDEDTHAMDEDMFQDYIANDGLGV